MIDLGRADGFVDAALARAPGVFLWWYVDLVTPEGDGAVAIWSYGLPFLPGHAAGARAGRPVPAASRPSVNLAVYRAGRPAFYLLQEHPPAPPEALAGLDLEQRIGGCTFRREVREGRCTLDAALDLALPGGGRATGTLRLEGVARAGGGAGEGVHLWTPLTGPARGRLELSVDGRAFATVEGRAYHDRNAGSVPLDALGIGRWMWGRVPLADRERIYYLLWPSAGGPPLAMGIDVDGDGRTATVPLEVDLGPERTGFGGVRRPERISLHHAGERWLEVRHRRVADAGPFYLRLLSEGMAGGERATGWSEVVVPARVDLARHRPFVRMRVHRVDGPNSPWLPLFAGPREGRAGRLLRRLAGLR